MLETPDRLASSTNGSTSASVASATAAPPFVPPLETGDRLTRKEFHRRYLAMPRVKKAELVDGVVYMASPVSTGRHGNPHLRIGTWLGSYELATPGVLGADNSSIFVDDNNEFQPDLFLILPPRLTTRSRMVDDYVVGVPDWVGEVAASSVSYDFGQKMSVYARHGVPEYVVWRVLDNVIDWFVLRNGNYEPLQPDAEGIFKSEIFPGLWLDPVALLGKDTARILEVQARALASPEHRQFVERLK